MKTNRTNPSTKLFSALVICGIATNVLVALVGVNNHDLILVVFSAILAIVSIASVLLVYKGQSELATHLVVIFYLGVFISASFTHVIDYALLLVFPFLISLTHYFFKDERVKNFYIAAALLGCFVTVFNSHMVTRDSIDFYQLAAQLFISMGLLISFIYTIKVQAKRIAAYQSRRDEIYNELADKNLALKDYIKSNLQLENFAHLASHDLKTPIKNICNFSQLLEKKMGDRLRNQEKEILDLLTEETRRLNNMMSDLLKLSQVSKKQIKYQKINGHRFINELIKENFDLDRGFVAVNAFPLELIAAESHLHILFYNLIENAVKFSGESKAPKITIYGRRSQDYFYFEIKDNGIGISDQYKKSVFNIFHKLNPQANTDGSGIGLSMCKEIIERHQGRIWIEDNPEGGSVVKFTLRRNMPEQKIEVRSVGMEPQLEVQIA